MKREARAPNSLEATASRVSSVEAGLQNEEENEDRMMIPDTMEDREDFDHHYGDFPGTIRDGQVRIGFANIYGIPSRSDHPKNTIIRESINRLGASVMGLAETNIHWKKLNCNDRWEERSRGWWENGNKYITSYNTLENPQHSHQPGGTMNIIRGDPVFRVIKQGNDDSKMGRWCWTLLSGKREVKTRIITAYRPCISRGLKSTYRQHKRIMDARKMDNCPRTQMIDDLVTAIQQWMERGEQIIVMIDLNDDVHNSTAATKLTSLGLNECISTRHSDTTPLQTCNKGKKAIDGIFTSNTLHITRGGYLPFNQFPTDHRALWVDITMDNLCGNNMAPILHPQARRLKCNDPITQKKWLHLYTNYLEERKAISRVYRLQNMLQKPLPPPLINEYEKLRTIRMDARKFADKRCRKLRMGGVPFSVELAAARSKIELWKTVVSWKMGKKPNMKHLQRLEKKNNSPGCRNITLQKAKENQSKAFKIYWETKRNADELRMTFLKKKANDLAQASNMESDNIYNQLITREAQRATARKIKFVLNRTQGGGVTKISLLNDTGNWEETTDKRKIEIGCANENASKYRQTENTPCMMGQLAKDLGRLGDTPEANDILNGRYTPPPGTNQYVAEFLQHLKYDKNAFNDPPQEIVSTQDYTTGWKKKKERISAGKSGWTFSHSKTCIMNKSVADFEATMAHIPYVTGYAPKEWKIGVNIMIYKKANLDRVDKLRTIVLKEADANFNDGKLGRDMMNHAEIHGMIAKEQYGSRKGHCSIDHAVNKRLTFDLLRLYRLPGALCSNDAKSCYDRVLHSIAALAMKRLGIPSPPIECMFECIQKMDHYIRTTYGDSDISYSSKFSSIPFQGVLQGNGAAPSIWVAVSTPLLNMMRSANHGMNIISAITKQQYNVVAFAFVDDTDLVQGNLENCNITADEVMDEMQEAILRWEGGLKATGGALVPAKSFVYPIDFKFNSSGKPTYKTVAEIGTSFEAPNANGVMTNLDQLEPSEARETLGVYLAPDGNNDEAVKRLREKAKAWSNLVTTGHLTAQDVRRAMDTTVIKSLEYPLPALTLSEKECKRIMAPVLEVALPKSNICRTYPRAVVYGPKGTLGLGLNNLYIVQGAKQIALLHQFLDTDTITGDLLKSCIEISKIHIGHGENLFTLDYNRLGQLLPKTWITNVWQFCHQQHIQFLDDVTPNLFPRRENDKFIMTTIAAHPEFTNNDLIHINRCRLYLKVTTISDITNGNGMLLRRGVMKGNMLRLNNPQYNWPRQSRPGINSWRIWRKALNRVILRQVRLHLKPEHVLGGWNDGDFSQWNWFFVRTTQKLYQRDLHRWKVYRRQGRGPIGLCSPFVYMSEALGLPDSAKRCTIFKDSQQRIRLSGTGRDLEKRNYSIDTSHTLLDNTVLKGNEDNLLQSIRNGTAKAVSDGSFLNSMDLGTAAFILEGDTVGDSIMGTHETPGSPDSQCAHRSEMFGILGLILMTNAVCKNNNIREGEITAKCDGEGTIKVLQYLHSITKNSRKHFDLIISISKAIQISPLKWTFEHLDGHQDDHMAFEDLDRWAQLNVIVDKAAKRELSLIIKNSSSKKNSIKLPYVKCRAGLVGDNGEIEPISSHMATSIIGKIQHSKIKEYWKEKKNLSNAMTEAIDWKILTKSAKNYARVKWVSKFVTGICGVGYMLKLWKHQDHSTCPRCGQENETTLHVLLCQEASASQRWKNALNSLDTWMTDNNAEPDMQEIIIKSLQSWRNWTTPPPSPGSDQVTLIQAMAEQNSIGWHNFIDGFISKQWTILQRQYLKELGSMKSPILWISRFQRRIWEIPWEMWLHRNEYLHNDGTTIHFQETVAINNEIREEYVTRGGDLPVSYLYLFHHPLDTLLMQSIFSRKEWLMSVWVARDHHTPEHSRTRNAIAAAYYNRWKKQLQQSDQARE